MSIHKSFFPTPEHEKMFAMACEESRTEVGTKSWDREEETDLEVKNMGKNIPTTIWHTKEQEELFERCARDSMSVAACLTY